MDGRGGTFSKNIQIYAPSSTIQSHIQGTMMDVLYNPTVGVNILSSSFASIILKDKPLAPTSKNSRMLPIPS